MIVGGGKCDQLLLDSRGRLLREANLDEVTHGLVGRTLRRLQENDLLKRRTFEVKTGCARNEARHCKERESAVDRAVSGGLAKGGDERGVWWLVGSERKV